MKKLLFISLLIAGCATALPGSDDVSLRKYSVPIVFIAPEALAEHATNYQ